MLGYVRSRGSYEWERRPLPEMVRSHRGGGTLYDAFSLCETGIEEVWVIGSLVICASVVHGVTATPLTPRSTAG